MIYPEEQQSIRLALQDSRKQGLIHFIDDFVVLLHQERFSFQDFIEALALWTFRQKPIPDLTTKYLEDAALELQKTKCNELQVNS